MKGRHGAKTPPPGVAVLQSPVSGVRAEGSGFENVMAVVEEPVCQSSPGTSIYNEPHGPATETGAQVSPDIIVWA